MPDLDLDAIERRAKAATPGPWEVLWETAHCWIEAGDECAYPDDRIIESEDFEDGATLHVHRLSVAHHVAPGVTGNYDYEEGGILETADAEFIAHARQDLPALSKALRSVLDLHQPHLEGSRHAWCTCCGESYPCRTVHAIQAAFAVNDEGGTDRA